MKVKINNLSSAVKQILKDYSDDVCIIVKESVDNVSKQAQKIVKSKAPVETGKYKRSIKVRTAYESLTEKRNVIFADKGEHRLTHLLENGHAIVGGGRTKKIPHWSYGDEYIKDELPKQVKEKLGGK